jgi:hypothetical protein
MSATKTQVTFYVEPEEKAKLMRDAKRFGLTLTELLNRGLRVGLPVVNKALRKAQIEERFIMTEKTKVNLDK